MAYNYKQQATAQAIAADLTSRTSLSTSVDLSTDAAGPLVLVGTLTAGQQGATVRVLGQRGAVTTSDPGWTDIIGSTQAVYTTGVAQFYYEAGSVAATSQILTTSNFLNILSVLVQRGMRIEIFSVANGTAPTYAGTTGWTANVTARGTFENNIWFSISDRV